MDKIKSLGLDHTKVKAPCVHLITVEEGKKDDKISNFDLRLVRPNENTIPIRGSYTIERLLAGLLYDRIDGYIDCLPFGCRTGFHLLVWGTPPTTGVVKTLKEALKETHDNIRREGIPGTTIGPCGNYRNYSLFSVR